MVHIHIAHAFSVSRSSAAPFSGQHGSHQKPCRLEAENFEHVYKYEVLLFLAPSGKLEKMPHQCIPCCGCNLQESCYLFDLQPIVNLPRKELLQLAEAVRTASGWGVGPALRKWALAQP